ncbi:MAG: TonB-dependent receptor [Bacteroidota bacterium]|nr:TonB-dependent receptor [Bacteroidota bacterium]
MTRAAFLLFSLLLPFAHIYAQDTDSLPTWEFQTVEIAAHRIAFGRMDVPMRKEALSDVLTRQGFTLVRRGVDFAQDIAVDGFRRGDIAVAVDGERYHSACPNRMDSPLTRVNPLDLASVTLQKSALDAVSGLAGSVHFRRRPPADTLRWQASLAGSAGAAPAADAAGLLETRGHALSLRYASGDPYTDGAGQGFTERYGYRSLHAYTLAEATLRGRRGDWQYGGGFSYTENVLFPFLLMDERFNRVTNGHVQWKNIRVYATYTDHLMTNEFRGGMMSMRTEARNLTVGVHGEYFEAWMRHWDADNRFDQRIDPDGNPCVLLGITAAAPLLANHMLPEVQQYYAAGVHRMHRGPLSAALRAGMSFTRIGDETRFPFYRELYADAENGRIYAVASAQVEWRQRAGVHGGYGLQLEAAAEPPQAEELYIAVRKPGGKPAWSGNPTLAQPLRGTLRASARWMDLQAEISASGVTNYVQPDKRSSAAGMYQSFANVDAWLAAATLRYERRLVTVDLAWTWGEQMESGSPLSEIPPLRAHIALRTPPWQNISLLAGITAQSDQRRVDPALAEFATAGWMRVDLGLRWSSRHLRANLLVENLFDRSYRQHLSYLRNPFAAGVQVFEPGRSVRLQLHIGS